MLMWKPRASARERILFRTSDGQREAGARRDAKIADDARRPPEQPRIGEAVERLVAMMDVLVVRREGRAVGAKKRIVVRRIRSGACASMPNVGVIPKARIGRSSPIQNR
jgi:hypothetical protein